MKSRSIWARPVMWLDSAISPARTGRPLAISWLRVLRERRRHELGTRSFHRQLRTGSNEKEVAFPLKSGRYVRLRALTEVGQRPYTAVAELSILQRQCLAPSVQLIQPRSKYIQRSSTLQLVADACPSEAGQGVKFVVDGVTLATDFSAPYTATATGLSAAEHIVEAYLVDGGGSQIVGHTTYDRSAPVGIGDTYVALGDGITYGLGDDVGTDDNSADGRNLLGGFESILADALTAARGYPVFRHQSRHRRRLGGQWRGIDQPVVGELPHGQLRDDHVWAQRFSRGTAERVGTASREPWIYRKLQGLHAADDHGHTELPEKSRCSS